MAAVELDPDRSRPATAGLPLAAGLRRILREPLLHFFLIGGMIFLGLQAWRSAHDPRRIVITPAVIGDLVEKYRMQFGAPPPRSELGHLVDAYVEEEVLYREGVALGLDRGDEIVRRRIAQKTRFVLQDHTVPPEPTDAQLELFLGTHPAAYARPARTSFTHLYFSPDRDGDAGARRRAVAALAQLKRGLESAEAGADAFPDSNAYADMDLTAATRLFGDTELSRRIGEAPIGTWAGPYRSGYGWHLVYVNARTPPLAPALGAVRDKVREDWLAEAEARANTAAYEALKRRYRVVRRDQEPGR
jgi:hypothetical protein